MARDARQVENWIGDGRLERDYGPHWPIAMGPIAARPMAMEPLATDQYEESFGRDMQLKLEALDQGPRVSTAPTSAFFSRFSRR